MEYVTMRRHYNIAPVHYSNGPDLKWLSEQDAALSIL